MLGWSARKHHHPAGALQLAPDNLRSNTETEAGHGLGDEDFRDAAVIDRAKGWLLTRLTEQGHTRSRRPGSWLSP